MRQRGLGAGRSPGGPADQRRGWRGAAGGHRGAPGSERRRESGGGCGQKTCCTAGILDSWVWGSVDMVGWFENEQGAGGCRSGGCFIGRGRRSVAWRRGRIREASSSLLHKFVYTLGVMCGWRGGWVAAERWVTRHGRSRLLVPDLSPGSVGMQSGSCPSLEGPGTCGEGEGGDILRRACDSTRWRGAGREGRRQRGGSATGICGWGVGRGGGLPTGILMMAYCALVRLVVAIVAFGGLPTGMVATGLLRKGGVYAG